MFPGNTPPRPVGKGIGFSRAAAADPVRREPVDVAKVIPADLRDKPKELVDFLSVRLFQNRASDKMLATFAQYLEARKPDTSDQTMRGLLHLMMSTPQFQLA
jgi:hypothetical protein